MRHWLTSWFLTGAIAAVWLAPASANAPPQPPAEKKDQTSAKAEDAKKPERDGSSQTIAYALAAIGVLVVMLLICMPVRRD